MIYTLRRCPFTGEAHDGGGPFAIRFDDGGIMFKCERSVHGPRKEFVPPPLPGVRRGVHSIAPPLYLLLGALLDGVPDAAAHRRRAP